MSQLSLVGWGWLAVAVVKCLRHESVDAAVICSVVCFVGVEIIKALRARA